jgi:hypothetical protein
VGSKKEKGEEESIKGGNVHQLQRERVPWSLLVSDFKLQK